VAAGNAIEVSSVGDVLAYLADPNQVINAARRRQLPLELT
jgi:hypothetical protein